VNDLERNRALRDEILERAGISCAERERHQQEIQLLESRNRQLVELLHFHLRQQAEEPITYEDINRVLEAFNACG